MASSPSLVLVDDHALFREALAAALKRRGFAVLGEAFNATSCFETVDACKPEVVLLDLRLPGMDGLNITQQLLKRQPELKVLIMSGYAQQQAIDDAWTAGAHGYASKTTELDVLVAGIQAVARGERWLAPMSTI